MANSSGMLAPGKTERGGDGGVPPIERFGGGAGGGWGENDARGSEGVPQRVYATGMGVAICGILMFFAALVSSSIVRQGLGAGDWRPMELPPVLWLNTAILVASSVSLARARRLQRAADEAGFRHWWSVTTALGVLFLAGQLIAWRQMAAAGLFLASTPASGFFYVFTGAHGLHLAGGIAALALVQVRRSRRLGRDTITQVVSMYWHFLTVLWIVLLVFFVWEKYS